MPNPAYTLEQLADILDFKREVMNQMQLISTLMAVLAMSVVAVLVAGPERGRFRSTLLVTLTITTLMFVFGTMLDVVILPAMKAPSTHSSGVKIRGLLFLSEVVVWDLLLGTIILFGSIGALGFVYSRRVGCWTMASAGAVLAVFVCCCFYLDRVVS